MYENGLDNDLLNLLYIENKEAEIAIKVKKKLTERVKVHDIIMQGSVWSSLKCTAERDKLHKMVMKNPSHQYSYKNDPKKKIRSEWNGK